MKKFIGIIIVATIVCGFVGGELTDKTFSITGAVIGGVSLAAILMGLGAFFYNQEKKRNIEITPEMRGVFDRMVGKESPPKPVKTEPSTQGKPKDLDVKVMYLTTIDKLISIQLMPKYPNAKDSFSELMVNKNAAGYIFGFHDSFLQRLLLVDRKSTTAGAELMMISYKRIFGESTGFALYSMSLSSQENSDFQEGRMEGGLELSEYLDKKTPPFGLGRILLLKP